MKLGIIIPDRRDRPKFLQNCLEMLLLQERGDSYDPFEIHVVSFPPTDDSVDITKRYRSGYDYFRGKGLDLLAFIENDDWYSRDYLKTMVAAWKRFKCPDLFGTCYTIYYHIELKAYFTMEHHTRSSAMNTFIKPDLDFPWPVDMEPFLDIHLWEMRNNPIKSRIVFKPDHIISVGIKHAQGKTIPGGLHVVEDRMRKKYINPDVNTEYPEGFLKTVMDAESFNFYNNYFK